jgi:hypothetical protein
MRNKLLSSGEPIELHEKSGGLGEDAGPQKARQ